MNKFSVGTIRKEGDEVRSKGYEDVAKIIASMEQNLKDIVNPTKAIKESLEKRIKDLKSTQWRKTDLVGLPIMASDLIHLEFRQNA